MGVGMSQFHLNVDSLRVKSYAQSAQERSQQTFEQKLNAWVEATPAGLGEDRDTAVRRIKEAYKYQRDSLSNLGLTSLPDGLFSVLTRLEELDLSNNQLRYLI